MIVEEASDSNAAAAASDESVLTVCLHMVHVCLSSVSL